jgi:hypothetical protein
VLKEERNPTREGKAKRGNPSRMRKRNRERATEENEMRRRAARVERVNEENETARMAAARMKIATTIIMTNAERNIRKSLPRESLVPIVPATTMMTRTLASGVVVAERSIGATVERTTRATTAADEKRRRKRARSTNAARAPTSLWKVPKPDEVLLRERKSKCTLKRRTKTLRKNKLASNCWNS